MTLRVRGMPVSVAITIVTLLVIGGYLLAIGLVGVISRRIESGDVTYPLTVLAGAAVLAIGAGVVTRRPWARVLGVAVWTLVALGTAAMMLFLTLMSGNVGVPFDDELFLRPFALLVLILATAIVSMTALIRARAWFATSVSSLRPARRLSAPATTRG